MTYKKIAIFFVLMLFLINTVSAGSHLPDPEQKYRQLQDQHTALEASLYNSLGQLPTAIANRDETELVNLKEDFYFIHKLAGIYVEESIDFANIAENMGYEELRDRLFDLATEFGRIQDEAIESFSTINTLLNELTIEGVEADYTALNDRLQAAQSSEASLSALADTIIQNQDTLPTAQNVQGQLQSLKTEVESIISGANSGATTASSLSGTALQDLFNTISTDAVQVLANVDQSIVDITQYIDNQNSTDNLQQEYQDLKDKFENYEEDYRDYKKEYRKAVRDDDERDINRYEKKLRRLDDRLDNLEDDLKELIDDAEDDNNDALVDDLEDLEDDVENLRNKIANLLGSENSSSATNSANSVVTTTITPSTDEDEGTEVIIERFEFPAQDVVEKSPGGWEAIRKTAWLIVGAIVLAAAISYLLGLILFRK